MLENRAVGRERWNNKGQRRSYNFYYQNCPNTQSDSDSTLSELTMKSKNRRGWKYDFIDLPCLQCISSTGYSFQNVEYVSLESWRIY